MKQRVRTKVLNPCYVCGKKGDRHHIIHKEEGGLDYPLNRIYLCDEHHRGPHGPHKDPQVDASYKKMLYEKLHLLFEKPYYQEEEIKSTIHLSASLLRTVTKTLKRYKEGYRNLDLIDFLMSGHQISDEDLEPELFLDE
jgi:hypothetical protein